MTKAKEDDLVALPTKNLELFPWSPLMCPKWTPESCVNDFINPILKPVAHRKQKVDEENRLLLMKNQES